MVNKERKERYIGIRQENTIFSSSYLKLMFSKVSPYEDMYEKDCADFSYYEIKQMYIMLSEISTGILATLNSQMLQYTSWCLGEGLVQDKQNHYKEFHSKSCIRHWTDSNKRYSLCYISISNNMGNVSIT